MSRRYSSWRDVAYAALRASNDVRAVRHGPHAVVRRVGRRAYGKLAGRLAGRIFR